MSLAPSKSNLGRTASSVQSAQSGTTDTAAAPSESGQSLAQILKPIISILTLALEQQSQEHRGGDQDAQSESNGQSQDQDRQQQALTLPPIQPRMLQPQSASPMPPPAAPNPPPQVKGAELRTPASPVASTMAPSPAQAQAQAAQAKTQKRGDIVATLGRHEGFFRTNKDHSLTVAELQQRIEDPKENAPPDLKQAWADLQNDPELMNQLDSQGGPADGHLNSKELNNLQQLPEFKAYNNQRSESYTQNYVPSDNTDPQAQARPMDENDAKRELFRYADNLSGNITLQEMQAVADGSEQMDKAPPQVQAAAKYYVDHPDAFKALTDNGESVKKSHFLQKCNDSIKLTAAENKTIDVISANKDTFFNKELLTRDKLNNLSQDSSKSQEVRDASTAMLKNPMLFSMMDNGKKGFGGSAMYKSDDGKIGSGDFDAFNAKRNHEVSQNPADGPQTDPSKVNPSAVDDMKYGILDQPDKRKSHGGQLSNFVKGLLKAVSFVEKAASTVLSAIGGLYIPGISQLATLGAIGTSAMGGAADIGVAKLDGKDVGKAAKSAGAGVAMTAATSMIPGGSVAKVGMGVAKLAGGTAAKTAGRSAVQTAPSAVSAGATKAAGSTVEAANGQLAKFALKQTPKALGKAALDVAQPDLSDAAQSKLAQMMPAPVAKQNSQDMGAMPTV